MQEKLSHIPMQVLHSAEEITCNREYIYFNNKDPTKGGPSVLDRGKQRG